MKANPIAVYFVVIVFLLSCQSATPIPTAAPSPTAAGQMETQVAATIYAEQTLTAAVKQATLDAALTADVLTAAVPTLTPTLSVATFYVSVPARACWMNSKVNVLTDQKVTISASGTVNTWGGREGSNGGPNGQKGLCGAIQCPLQGVGYGALIGRLEDLKPFFVGTAFEFTATEDGQLYFTVNDWECEDNSGAFKLNVTVE